MTERAWWKEAVVYQIYTKSFQDTNGDGIGDLPGVISRIDYLKDLGVDIIWLNPVYDTPNDDNGYDISNYQTILKEFGDITDWERLLHEIHARGMRLIMDLVINHTSDEHSWFEQSKQSKDNPYRDFYIWKDPKNNQEPNNWGSFFEGPAWTYDETTQQYYLHLFSKKQPDLNWDNPDVEREIFDMIQWWLDKGVDGFRMDVINLIKKPEACPDSKLPLSPGEKNVLDMKLYANNPGVHKILQKLNKNVLSKHDLFTVGEVISTTPEEAIKYVMPDREELQMLIHFEVPAITREWELKKFKKIQSDWYSIIENGGWNAQYLSNHDQPRQVSIFGDDKEFWKESAKMLALLNHTMPGTVFIHQGEEIGMKNGVFGSIDDFRDISAIRSYEKRIRDGEDQRSVLADLCKFSRDNGRLPMQWDDSENSGFTTGKPWIGVNPNYRKINVEVQLKDVDSILSFYRELIRLRKDSRCLVYGALKDLDPSHDSIYCYKRYLKDETLLILLNFTPSLVEYQLPEGVNLNQCSLVMSNYPQASSFTQAIPFRPFEALLFSN